MSAGAAVRSWVEVPDGSDFPLENLPYGAFITGGTARLGIAIGERILNLHATAEAGLFDGAVSRDVLRAPVLNPLLEAGPTVWTAVRERAFALLREDTELLGEIDRDALLVAQRDARMAMPFRIGDYVDFYSSLEHASNLGKIFRPDGDPLMPNWRWLPVAYHGRSSTVVVDGTPIVRPSGQHKAPDAATPAFGPTRLLDIELEMGFVTGAGNVMGTRIPVQRAREHIFGLVLVNDWSARDIQAWEYQPLGPFLGKSFATSISPWVVPLAALEPYRVAGPPQEPPPLPYLQSSGAWNFDIDLCVALQSEKMREEGIAPHVVSHSNFKHVYWNIAQQLAHVTVNGTAVRAGDLYASGTISGADSQSYGSLIELTWRGAKPLTLPSNELRTFLEDGDTVILRGACEAPGKPRIGFGAVRGTILPCD